MRAILIRENQVRAIQFSSRFWYHKLNKQLSILKKKYKNSENTELEIGLTYLFLFLLVESIVDEAVLFLMAGNNDQYKQYKKNNHYLLEKLHTIFDNCCPHATQEEKYGLEGKVILLRTVRNKVVHLYDIAWDILPSMPTGFADSVPDEFTTKLTISELKEYLSIATDFLTNLKDLLSKHLNYPKMIKEYHKNKKLIKKKESEAMNVLFDPYLRLLKKLTKI